MGPYTALVRAASSGQVKPVGTAGVASVGGFAAPTPPPEAFRIPVPTGVLQALRAGSTSWISNSTVVSRGKPPQSSMK